MDFQLILSFAGASILLALLPGPDNLLVLSESIAQGRKSGISLATGLSVGVLGHTIAAATGLSLLIQQSAIAFQVIKYLGAAYLAYLAIQAMRAPAKPAGIESSSMGKSFTKLFKKGLVMNILNPKVSLFFIAFLPQFISPNGLNPGLQMVILGVLFMLVAMVCFYAIALLAGSLHHYLQSPRFWVVSKWGKASVLLVLSVALAVSKR